MSYKNAGCKRYRARNIVLFWLLLLSCVRLFFTAEASDREIIVSFTASNSWEGTEGTYYQYDVSVHNGTGSRMDSWKFQLDLGEDGVLDQAWSCVASEDDHFLTVTPMEWNTVIDDGNSVSGIGIVLGSRSGDRFTGSYRCDPATGSLSKIATPDPTVTPTPEVTLTPTPMISQSPSPTVTPLPTGMVEPQSYPSGTGMYGALTLHGPDLYGATGSPVQLRGISTHGIAWFPQYVNLETFRYLRDEWGVNLIRLAMYTAESGGYCSGGNKEYLEDLIDKGVQACTSLGMYCIIDWHILADNDPNMNKDAALDFFARMSEKYAGYNNVLYEICNEPHWVDWVDIKQYADEVIPVIRRNAPHSIIIVGTNTWSQDIMDPAANPVAEPYNVMYAVHFYAATHGGWLRERVMNARNSGVPVFISEFSICDASGNGAIDYTEAAGWKDLIMNCNLSYAGWNLANKDESSSIILSSCSKLLGWTEDEISDTGKWLRTLIKEGKALEPEIILPDDELDTLFLPESLLEIEEEAFTGMQAQCVVIPANVRTIDSRAFADSGNLKKVILKGASTEIAEDAFEGCGEIEIECYK